MNLKTSRADQNRTKARSNYNRLSRWYDWIAGSSEMKFRQEGIQALNLHNGEKVLEIGFGTAHSLVSFAEAVGKKGRVTGIDISDGMVRIARQRIARHGLEERVATCLADGVRLPFCADLFDAVFLCFTLELFDSYEIKSVLDQCRRVLRPGGRLVNVSLAKTSDPGFAERIYEWFHARMPAVIDCHPIDIGETLVSAGFEIGESRRSRMWGLPVDVILAKVRLAEPVCM